jgi:hypothetical protein
MIVATDEITRSLGGAWGLLQRDATGLRQFDASRSGLLRSFGAVLLAAPAFVIALAAERARFGLLLPGSTLFDDPSLGLRLALMFAAAWALPPIVAFLMLKPDMIAQKLATFTVACNWSAVLAAFFVALPAFLLARGLATPPLTAVYLLAFVALIAHTRWFIARHALGLSGGLAAGLIAADLGLELALGRALALA